MWLVASASYNHVQLSSVCTSPCQYLSYERDLRPAVLQCITASTEGTVCARTLFPWYVLCVFCITLESASLCEVQYFCSSCIAANHPTGSYHVTGVHRDELVRSLPQFPRRRIINTLTQLQQSSDIFEADKNCYKAVVS